MGSAIHLHYTLYLQAVLAMIHPFLFHKASSCSVHAIFRPLSKLSSRGPRLRYSASGFIHKSDLYGLVTKELGQKFKILLENRHFVLFTLSPTAPKN
jgi:hypothetical protein